MDAKKIKKYAEIMEELGLSALEITKFGEKVRLERETSKPLEPALSAPTRSEAAVAAAPTSSDKPAPVAEEAGVYTLTSPMIGAFYVSPAENQEPFVNVGDKVAKGDVLCIIESMKLMNEITSDVDGVILEVCAANRQAVDYGHPLFKIKLEA